jgi:hypothetical protein
VRGRQGRWGRCVGEALGHLYVVSVCVSVLWLSYEEEGDESSW